ncbi:hypothetical protein B0T26DRAFT_432457 [Lasiosphaeria miniovina]|uniref:Uncharacterized protein n=1 Tax=Lasiosphaeria miniovina TaxID=1954250 RepID=A0AA40A6E6_9PEZI|nr:uncharacterized protein B0T26DRAFT_432457 [Lasiosphaeria miniovina]KAK0710097.1 hypothetical protein B0T26DRAFT_432457 [Lasiosphaeria miniovina]
MDPLFYSCTEQSTNLEHPEDSSASTGLQTDREAVAQRKCVQLCFAAQDNTYLQMLWNSFKSIRRR